MRTSGKGMEHKVGLPGTVLGTPTFKRWGEDKKALKRWKGSRRGQDPRIPGDWALQGQAGQSRRWSNGAKRQWRLIKAIGSPSKTGWERWQMLLVANPLPISQAPFSGYRSVTRRLEKLNTNSPTSLLLGVALWPHLGQWDISGHLLEASGAAFLWNLIRDEYWPSLPFFKSWFGCNGWCHSSLTPTEGKVPRAAENTASEVAEMLQGQPSKKT